MGTMENTRSADKLTGAVLADDPYEALWTLEREGWIRQHLPEVQALAASATTTSGRALHKDNLDHSFKVCAQTPRRLTVRLAGLLHDIGKPPTMRRTGGTVSFHQHETIGSRLATKALRRLAYPDDTVADVAALVELSGRTYGFDGHWTDSAIRRVASDAGNLLEDLLDLSRADCTSKRPGRRAEIAGKVDRFALRLEHIRAAEAQAAVRPALNGHEIAALLGVEGRELGLIWRWLQAEAQHGRCLNRAEAEQAVIARWQAPRRNPAVTEERENTHRASQS